MFGNLQKQFFSNKKAVLKQSIMFDKILRIDYNQKLIILN